MPGYADEVAGFERSRVMFDSVVAELANQECAQVIHAELEERLTGRSREPMRQLSQDHVDVRAVREERRTAVVGADRVARRRVKRGHHRALGHGVRRVQVERLAYRAAGASNLHPADAQLNLPEGRHSHGLRRLAAIESVRGSLMMPPRRSPGRAGSVSASGRSRRWPGPRHSMSRRFMPARLRKRPTRRRSWCSLSTARALSCSRGRSGRLPPGPQQ
jgi:hypothetical protein